MRSGPHVTRPTPHRLKEASRLTCDAPQRRTIDAVDLGPPASPRAVIEPEPLRIVLGGDLMLGRGIDQCMARHVDPRLFEPVVRDARHYVELAERRHGPIAAPLSASAPWGDALAWLEVDASRLRVVNLETAITSSPGAWIGKAVHYRMHPANVRCLQAARIDACSLANNHVLDWGHAGLADTLQALRRAGIRTAGAGLNARQAERPARLPLAAGGALLLFAWAFPSSGVPLSWQAGSDQSGVALLERIDEASLEHMRRCIAGQRRPGDRVVVSLHWGGNWVDEIPEPHRWLARRLIDQAGVDVVFGHSSHHPLPLELHHGRLILYGCGDLINDYEGLPAHGQRRSDLVCLYGLELNAGTGALRALELRPFQLRGFQLRLPQPADREWLASRMGLETPPRGWCWQSLSDHWRLEPANGGAASEW